MNEYLRDILQYKCQIQTNSPVVVGVSGGPDSLFLLDLLLDFGAQVIVAHLNHELRPESSDEANFVKNIAKERGVKFCGGKVDVKFHAQEFSLSIEESARILRYRFLFEQAKHMQAQAVAVGHTANDQVETLLMNLMRGSGMRGLGGMDYRLLPSPWSDEIAVVRPLLGIWRWEINAYLESQNISPIIDTSNQDVSLLRNKIRLEVIPFLEKHKLHLQEILWQTSEVLRSEDHYLNEVTEDAWKKCFEVSGLGWIALSRPRFLEFDIAIQRRLLRRAISYLRSGLLNIGFSTIEKGRSFIYTDEHSKNFDLASGLFIRLENNRVWLADWETELPSQDWPQFRLDKILELSSPDRVDMEGGWFLSIQELQSNEWVYDQISSNQNPNQAWIDAEKVHLPLFLRNRKHGDRFQPFGMKGHKVKLSDFMINLKMPIRSRDRWPLVCDQNAIVWIPGYRLGHPFQVTENTKKIYFLDLRKSNAS